MSVEVGMIFYSPNKKDKRDPEANLIQEIIRKDLSTNLIQQELFLHWMDVLLNKQTNKQTRRCFNLFAT